MIINNKFVEIVLFTMRYPLLAAAIAAIALGIEFADSTAKPALVGDTVGEYEDCNYAFNEDYGERFHDNLCAGEHCEVD